MNDNITANRITQSYLDGETNCVFTPIRKWLETELEKEDISPSRKKKLQGKLKPLTKFEEQYKDGVPEENMEESSFEIEYEVLYS